MKELVRHVRLADHPEYEILLFDLNEMKGNHHRMGYIFMQNKEVIFEGDDFGVSQYSSVDGDEALRSLMGFLTLRRGDTDADYFDSYSEDQLSWAEENAEELSLYGMDDMADEDMFEDVESD